MYPDDLLGHPLSGGGALTGDELSGAGGRQRVVMPAPWQLPGLTIMGVPEGHCPDDAPIQHIGPATRRLYAL